MTTQLSLWERFNTYFRHYDSVGISLDISRMRFPENFFDSMKTKMNAAFSAMEALEQGALANPDEKRMVGHYWLRNSALAPTKEIRTEIDQAKAKVLAFAESVLSEKILTPQGETFQELLLVGIGGSALGPQLVSDALGDLGKKGLRLSFLDNTDPDGMIRTLGKLNLSRTLVAIVSKSGGTVETRNGMLETKAAFERTGLRFSKHFVAVTVPGSNLEKTAQAEGWLDIFPMFDWVGGRTSLFSAVGLLPAALEGIPVEELLRGASEMDALTRTKDPLMNPAALLAQLWHYAGNGRGEKDMVILPYKDRLVLFSKYLQQLIMESLGKEHDLSGAVVHQGIAVYGNKGSTDQHAYVQQLRDGVHNFFATFIEVLADATSREKTTLQVKEHVTSGDYLNGFFQGTRTALYEKGRDSITLTLDSLTPFSLGALIALYERAVGFYASLVNINAYHQPGVEAGKKAAERVVELQQQILKKVPHGTYTATQIAESIGAPEEVETVYRTLSHLAADSRGITIATRGTPKGTLFKRG